MHLPRDALKFTFLMIVVRFNIVLSHVMNGFNLIPRVLRPLYTLVSQVTVSQTAVECTSQFITFNLAKVNKTGSLIRIYFL